MAKLKNIMRYRAEYSGQNVAYQNPTYPPPYEANHTQQVYMHGQPIIIQPGAGPSIVTTAVVVNPMGARPVNLTCKACRAEIVTNLRFKSTARTHLLALLLCVLGCWPCVCVPYCMDSCQNADHYCPNCNAYIGTYQQ